MDCMCHSEFWFLVVKTTNTFSYEYQNWTDLPTFLLPLLMWHQVSSWLQACISLVPIHQGVQLRRAGTTLYTAASNTPEQHVHAVTDGYHHGGGLRPGRGRRRRRWLRKEALPVYEEEELRHVSSHRDCWMQRWRCENTKRRPTQRSTRGVLLSSISTDMHTTW